MNAFITTTGRIIKIDVGYLQLERSSEAPGVVVLTSNGAAIRLPTNPGEAEAFIAAYRRAIAEDVGYRKSEVETAEGGR